MKRKRGVSFFFVFLWAKCKRQFSVPFLSCSWSCVRLLVQLIWANKWWWWWWWWGKFQVNADSDRGTSQESYSAYRSAWHRPPAGARLLGQLAARYAAAHLICTALIVAFLHQGLAEQSAWLCRPKMQSCIEQTGQRDGYDNNERLTPCCEQQMLRRDGQLLKQRDTVTKHFRALEVQSSRELKRAQHRLSWSERESKPLGISSVD